jgi:16S rRNA (cytosine967-C5)-methyltransferase
LAPGSSRVTLYSHEQVPAAGSGLSFAPLEAGSDRRPELIRATMISPDRQVAYELLRRIELQGSFSDYALNSPAMSCLQQPDRNLVTEIVYGTLRWQGFIDHFAAAVSSRPWSDVRTEAKIAIRMGIYQMARMDRIPDRALVHDAVEIAKAELGKGTAGFVNAVLRSLSRTRPWRTAGDLPEWDAVSLPEWLWRRWSTRFGKTRAREYALSLNEPPQPAIRIPRTPCGGDMAPSDLVPGAGLVRHTEGIPKEIFQDEASQLVPHLFGEIKGRSVWDACAAPGGKTEILLAMTGRDGMVISSDANTKRAARMARLFSGSERAGSVLAADARRSLPFRAQFDAILVDAPCSGLGTLRRNPEIKWRFLPERLNELHEVQHSILQGASTGLKVGGRLIYSTCSTEPEEGESVVRRFLDLNPGFCVIRPETPKGIEAFLDDAGILRTFPSRRLWDGFFAALIARRF